VLRRIFGPKREEDRSRRQLHNEVGRTCSTYGRGVYRILVRRPEGKRPLGRPRRRWEDNIKMDLREIGISRENWIRRVQDRVWWWAFVNTVMNLRVPQEIRLFDKVSDYQLFKEYPSPWSE
jgi:hypothetical protein